MEQPDQKKLQDILRQRDKYESLGVLAGGIAHDFRNYLSGIVTQAEIAREHLGKHSENNAGTLAEDALETILNSAKQAGELVRRLLAFSDPGALLEPVPVDLHREVRTVCRLVGLNPAKNTRLINDPDPSELWISSYPYALQQVCLNLIVNAVDAIGDRGGFVRVETSPLTLKVARTTREGRTMAPGKYAAIRIIDNGPGIPDAVRHKIFDPFFSTKGRNDRNGLGLAMVRQIIEETNGDLNFESALGVGTRFEIIIPIVESPVGEVVEETKSDFIPRLTEGNAAESKQSPSSILFLEDDPTISEGARIILESCGFRVEHYDNGHDGLIAIQRPGAHFDLVVCDFHLCDMDATEFIRRSVPLDFVKRYVLVMGSLNHIKRIGPEEAYIEEIFEKPISYFTVAKRLHAILGNKDIQVPEFTV